jgi:hypothetical protein
MTASLQKYILGASAIVGIGAIAATPAAAASLSNVQMFGDDYRTYTGSSVSGSEQDAIDALTDSDRYTNVELNFANENLSDNVTGFTGQLGSQSVTVEGITDQDWNNGLRQQWLGDFKTAYKALDTSVVIDTLFGSFPLNFADTVAASLENRSGDPNVASMTKDNATGEISLDLIGHYNIWDTPWMSNVYANFGDTIEPLKEAVPTLQISEIAKVTVDGEVSYAYSFSAEETGVLAVDAADNDTSSHTGRYTWTTQGTVEPSRAQVPEPSAILGLTALSGLLVFAKRKTA